MTCPSPACTHLQEERPLQPRLLEARRRRRHPLRVRCVALPGAQPSQVDLEGPGQRDDGRAWVRSTDLGRRGGGGHLPWLFKYWS